MISLVRRTLSGVLLCLLAGCSDNRGTVQGTAILDGKPLDGGNVVFTPVKGGPAAYGSIGSGGRFTVATGDAAGLKPGEYVATVSVQTIPEDGSGETARFITPAKYASAAKSGLKVTIEAGRNSVVLNLTSE